MHALTTALVKDALDCLHGLCMLVYIVELMDALPSLTDFATADAAFFADEYMSTDARVSPHACSHSLTHTY